MAGVIGELVRNEVELKRIAAERRKKYSEVSIWNEQVESYEADGWEVTKRGKTKTRLRKQKSSAVYFEDRVWMLFFNLGFSPDSQQSD